MKNRYCVAILGRPSRVLSTMARWQDRIQDESFLDVLELEGVLVYSQRESCSGEKAELTTWLK